jgi:NADPH-dependent ferric siderophore reductase
MKWADWNLFADDETATPAIAAMLEALPAETSGIALLEVDSPSDIFKINTKSSVEVR